MIRGLPARPGVGLPRRSQCSLPSPAPYSAPPTIVRSRATSGGCRRSTPSNRQWRRCPTRRCAAKTAEFRERLAGGATLDDLLPEAFAVVREAAKRTLGQRHFDVQLVGGMVLHDGKIAEMKTGEGKTLVATLPVYLNALAGKGVHIVTVNDYLARRDAEWMGQIYQFLGMTRRRHRARPGRRPAARAVRRRHHLRHQQRVRLRLPARQHEVPAGGHGPARLLLRHRRRGGQHPDRRGAHAADHLRPGRGQLRPVSPGRRGGEGAGEGRQHLRQGREIPHRRADRARLRAGRGHAARGRHHHRGQPLRHLQRLGGASRAAVAARAHAVRPRRRLHRARRTRW